MSREHEKLCLSQTFLVGFNGKATHVGRQLMLEVVTREVQVNTLFLINGSISPYNAIFGLPWIHAITTVTSTYHPKIKIATPKETIEIASDQLTTRKCHFSMLSTKVCSRGTQPSTPLLTQ